MFEAASILFEDGITGQTKRDGGVGCVCHNLLPDTNVSVVISGPDSVVVGQTAIYKLTLSHGPAQTGGCDIASYHGIIDTFYLDFHTLQRDTARNELTHRFPKGFIADSVWWTFKYIAPSSPQVDTIYADGNSTNADFIDDTLDHWNFASNKTIRVYVPIGIKPISNLIPDKFELFQNYPNPFNPSTKIKFSIPTPLNPPEGGTQKVKLVIYDILGREIASLIPPLVGGQEGLPPGTYDITWNASSQPSGIYFARLQSGNNIVTRKMILIK